MIEKITIFIYIQISLLLLCILEYFYLFTFEGISFENAVEILKYEFLFVYIWSIVSARVFLPWKSIYLFFLFTMMIFQYDRIFLDIFDLYYFDYASKWGYFYFPAWVSAELLLLFILGLLLIHLGVFVAIYFFRKTTKTTKTKIFYSDRLFQIGRFIFLVAYPMFMYKLIIQVKYILVYGYLAVYTEAFKHLNYPIWTKGSGTLLVLGFSFILASLPRKRSFLLYSFLFILTQIAVMIQGARGGFIVFVMIVIWYYYKFYVPKKQDINIKKISFIVIVFIVLAQFINVSRSGGEFGVNNLGDILALFAAQQGTSIQVPFYMIYYKNSFINDGLPYILNPILTLGSMSPSQTTETLEQHQFLGHHLTYFINSEAYFSGEGIGGSFIGELYDLPLFWMIGVYFLLGYFIVYFEKSVENSRLLLLFVYLITERLIWMPRGSMLLNINLIIMILFIYIFAELIKKKEKNELT